MASTPENPKFKTGKQMPEDNKANEQPVSTGVGDGSGQKAMAENAQPAPEKPVTAAEQVAPGKAGDAAEGKNIDAVKPAPAAAKPVADAAAKPAAPAAAKPAAPAAPKPPAGPKPEPWEAPLAIEMKKRYGSGVKEASSYVGQNYFVVDKAVLGDVLLNLRDAGFDYCVDITAVHYPKNEQPFEVVYILYSFPRNERVRVKAGFGDGEPVPSVVSIWQTANWLEREAYDMFGIKFQGHPDLRRILLPEDWKGFPLRKDYSILQQDNEWVQSHLGIESGQ